MSHLLTLVIVLIDLTVKKTKYLEHLQLLTEFFMLVHSALTNVN